MMAGLSVVVFVAIGRLTAGPIANGPGSTNPTPAAGGPDAIAAVIEIDGNVKDSPAGAPTDWCAIVAGSAPNVELFSGVNADLPPKTIFTGGGSKDELDIPNWEWKDGSVPDKDDIRNALAAILRDPVTHHRILAFAGDRHAINGDAQIGFWLFQEAVGPIGTTSGTFSGHHRNGDLLVLAHFVNGGSIGDLLVYRWNTSVPGNLQLLGSSPQAGIASALNVATLGTADTCFASGVWQYQPKQGTNNTYPANSFFEGAIDLELFVPDVTCFHSFILETRSSQSTDAVLKDFVTDNFNTCADIRGRKLEVADDGTCNTVIGPLANWEIRLYEDANNNNQGDPGELVTTDGNGATLANPVCTNANGEYAFVNLPVGRRYIVCEVIPDRQAGENFNWINCKPGPADGHPGATTSSTICAGQNANGREFCYNAFVLSGDAVREFRNFKQITTCVLSGVKFCDKNGNGVRDADDFGLPGFCITVVSLDGGPAPNPVNIVTGANGSYSTTVESGHTYGVSEDLDGSTCGSADRSAVWIPTTPPTQSVFVPPGVSVCPAGPNVGNKSRPTINCGLPPGQSNVNLNNDPGLCTARFCFTPTCDNLCGSCNVTCVATSPSGQNIPLTPGPSPGQLCGNFPAGCPAVSTVTCTATTQAGLTATCTFTVTVTLAFPL